MDHVARLDHHQPGASSGGVSVGDEQRSQSARIHETALRQPDADDIVLLPSERVGEQCDAVGVDFADDVDRPVTEIMHFQNGHATVCISERSVDKAANHFQQGVIRRHGQRAYRMPLREKPCTK